MHPKLFDDFTTWAAFTSIVVDVLYRDILGLYHVDASRKVIELRFLDVDLEHCEGAVPAPDGIVRLRWTKRAGRLEYEVNCPDDYQITVRNHTFLDLIGPGSLVDGSDSQKFPLDNVSLDNPVGERMVASPSPLATWRALAKLLGKCDDDPFRSADVG